MSSILFIALKTLVNRPRNVYPFHNVSSTSANGPITSIILLLTPSATSSYGRLGLKRRSVSLIPALLAEKMLAAYLVLAIPAFVGASAAAANRCSANA